jgi:hypothetical protein
MFVLIFGDDPPFACESECKTNTRMKKNLYKKLGLW